MELHGLQVQVAAHPPCIAARRFHPPGMRTAHRRLAHWNRCRFEPPPDPPRPVLRRNPGCSQTFQDRPSLVRHNKSSCEVRPFLLLYSTALLCGSERCVRIVLARHSHGKLAAVGGQGGAEEEERESIQMHGGFSPGRHRRVPPLCCGVGGARGLTLCVSASMVRAPCRSRSGGGVRAGLCRDGRAQRPRQGRPQAADPDIGMPGLPSHRPDRRDRSAPQGNGEIPRQLMCALQLHAPVSARACR